MNTQLTMAQLVAELPDTTLAANWADDFLAQLTLAVCHTDSTGHFVDVNDAYCALYGYTQEELIGQHFSIVIPEGYRAVATGIHDAFISGSEEHAGEWTVVNKLGQHMRIQVTPIRLQDENGNTSKITLIEKLDD
jgi:PAS domain S-box-containing protein